MNLKFSKLLYRFVDALMVRSSFPIFGKLANKIRVFFGRRISKSISKKSFIEKGAKFGANVEIKDYGCVGINCDLGDNVSIGIHTMMGPNCHFFSTNHKRKENGFEGTTDIKRIVVGDYCWIGYGCIFCSGSMIGNNSTIGAGSVVTKQFGDNVLVAGNPAIIKKTYRKIANE